MEFLHFLEDLDTSVVVKYLQEEYNMDVITVTVDVGQGDDLKKISSKAKRLGVKNHYNIDARQEFVEKFIFPSIKANALYQKKYCLATAFARPLIAEKVLEVAKKEKATALAHGCTGKGNDQVRFDITFRSGSRFTNNCTNSRYEFRQSDRVRSLQKNTELQLIRLQKDSASIKTCGDERLKVEYWKMHILNHQMMHSFGSRQKICQTNQQYLEIKFEKGIPVAVDGKRMKSIKLIKYVNKKAGATE